MRAARARKAVILRRGPTKQVCLVAWDLSNDALDIGQWFKGRVYEEKCDLSPDGAWMLAFMASQRPPFRTWTALCRPPFFTAVTLWPEGGTYGGGGRFLGERSLTLFHGSRVPPLAEGFPPPAGFEVVPHTVETMDRIEAMDRRSLGTRRPGMGHGSRGLAVSDVGGRLALLASGSETPLPGISWADVDENGDLLLAAGGRLHRLKARRLPARPDVESLLDASRLVADLTDLRFRNLEAPYDSPRTVTVPGEPKLDLVSREDRRARPKARRSEAL